MYNVVNPVKCMGIKFGIYIGFIDKGNFDCGNICSVYNSVRCCMYRLNKKLSYINCFNCCMTMNID